MAGISNNPTPYNYGSYKVTNTGGVTGTPDCSTSTTDPTGTSAVTMTTSALNKSEKKHIKEKIKEINEQIKSLTARLKELQDERNNLYQKYDIANLEREYREALEACNKKYTPMAAQKLRNAACDLHRAQDAYACACSAYDKAISEVMQELTSLYHAKSDLEMSIAVFTEPTSTGDVTPTNGNVPDGSIWLSRLDIPSQTTIAPPQAPTQTTN